MLCATILQTSFSLQGSVSQSARQGPLCQKHRLLALCPESRGHDVWCLRQTAGICMFSSSPGKNDIHQNLRMKSQRSLFCHSNSETTRWQGQQEDPEVALSGDRLGRGSALLETSRELWTVSPGTIRADGTPSIHQGQPHPPCDQGTSTKAKLSLYQKCRHAFWG
jgi:hypothetical protein